MMHMLFLKVPIKEGERVRRELVSGGLLSKEYGIIKEKEWVFFPVLGGFGDYASVDLDAQKRPQRHDKLEDALSGLLTEDELKSLITSFDIIGDIAIVEIPASVESKESEIGNSLLKVHRNLRTVLKKMGPMEGEFRVRRLKVIAGEDRTETIYKENGVLIKLDLAKVYFSVRLSTERKRIAELVKGGEHVLVLFAGVGPFALAIAKTCSNAKITAVEINPDAVIYMRENIGLNKIKNIEAVEGDAKNIRIEPNSFDRIVMPLPKSAHEFLDVAFSAAKNGGVVHFYTIVDSKRAFAEAVEKAEEAAEKSKVKISVISQRVVRPYSPSQVQVVLDLEVIYGN